MDRQLVFELPNDVHCIEDAVEFVVSRCSSCHEAAAKLRLNFRVGLCEALSNAMIYGNGGDPTKRVRLEIRVGPDCLTAQVTDQGHGFDPARVPDPTAPVNLCREQGRGLFLMRQLMDEVHFNDQGNSVKLVLYLSDGKPGRREASA